MVNGSGRGRSPYAWFVGGSLTGGMVSGAVVGLIALLVPTPPVWLAVALVGLTAALVVLRDTGLAAVPFPQNARQVRQSVTKMHPASGALMFGFELGTGARTFMTGAAPYIAIAAVLVAGGHGMLPGLLAGAGFGLGRGLVPVERALPGGEHGWDEWIRKHGEGALPVLGAGATALAAVLVLLR